MHRYASFLLAILTLAAPQVAHAFDITGAAESVLQPTQEAVEDVMNWKDAAPQEMRREQCDAEGGLWVQRLVVSGCENGSASIDADGAVTVQHCGAGHHAGSLEMQCAHHDALGNLYFNDGPSVPPAMLTISSWIDDSIDQLRYNELFWQAGVLHDHCYHGNPITYGLSRSDCDERFIEDLLATCVHHNKNSNFTWFKNDVCHTYAKLMYGMVRSYGEDSFSGFNLEAQYDQPEPLYKQYGLGETPYTQACKADIEDFLVKYNVMSESQKEG